MSREIDEGFGRQVLGRKLGAVGGFGGEKQPRIGLMHPSKPRALFGRIRQIGTLGVGAIGALRSPVAEIKQVPPELTSAQTSSQSRLAKDGGRPTFHEQDGKLVVEIETYPGEISGAPEGLEFVAVNTDQGTANFRSAPVLSNETLIGEVPNEMVFQTQGWFQAQDGRVWLHVQSIETGETGWLAVEVIQPTEDPQRVEVEPGVQQAQDAETPAAEAAPEPAQGDPNATQPAPEGDTESRRQLPPPVEQIEYPELAVDPIHMFDASLPTGEQVNFRVYSNLEQLGMNGYYPIDPESYAANVSEIMRILDISPTFDALSGGRVEITNGGGGTVESVDLRNGVDIIAVSPDAQIPLMYWTVRSDGKPGQASFYIDNNSNERNGRLAIYIVVEAEAGYPNPASVSPDELEAARRMFFDSIVGTAILVVQNAQAAPGQPSPSYEDLVEFYRNLLRGRNSPTSNVAEIQRITPAMDEMLKTLTPTPGEE